MFWFNPFCAVTRTLKFATTLFMPLVFSCNTAMWNVHKPVTQLLSPIFLLPWKRKLNDLSLTTSSEQFPVWFCPTMPSCQSRRFVCVAVMYRYSCLIINHCEQIFVYRSCFRHAKTLWLDSKNVTLQESKAMVISSV